MQTLSSDLRYLLLYTEFMISCNILYISYKYTIIYKYILDIYVYLVILQNVSNLVHWSDYKFEQNHTAVLNIIDC